MRHKRAGIGASLAFVVTLVILVAGAGSLVVLDSNGITTVSFSTVTSSSSQTKSSITSVGTGTEVVSQNGLDLEVNLSRAQLAYGQSIQVNVSEFNTLDRMNSLNSSEGWFVPVALGSCANLNYLPIGISLYQGHLTADNVSVGTQIQIFPATACPMIERYISGYQFQSESDLATILPGSAPTTVSASVDLVNATSIGVKGSSPLSPGQYTLVAADEWGAAAFLYFQVQGVS